MKSNITHKEKKNTLPFPKLMIDPSDNQVVLFFDYANGTVVYEGNCTHSLLGENDTFDIYDFEEFDGTVTLSNK